MKLIVISAAITGLAAAPALAGSYEPAPAETVVMAPAPVAVAPAGTDWTGFYLGGQLGYGVGESNTAGGNEDIDGLLGGVNASYLHDLGNFVVGGEVAYNLADLAFEGPTVGQVEQLAQAKLKVGYDLGRALVYGTAGGAWADVKADGAKYDDFGWTAGAGVDYMVTDNVVAGVEYTYNRFDDFDGTGNDWTANTVAAKVGFKF